MTIKEYQKDLNKDVSNFLTELQQKFPDMVITSGFRKNSVTKFGKKSRHSTGEAVDLRINPEISNWLYNTKEGITTLNKHGLGMLDESLPENKKFGNAVHIGKDTVPVERARNRYKELFGVDYGQETQPQEQENVINYVIPSQDTTIVTNLPKSEESINFAEETRKLEQQKQEEFQKFEQEINQRAQVQPQEQQIEEEEYAQSTPQINYQDIFNQVSQFVDAPIAQQGVTWSKQQQALKEEKLAKLKKLLEQEKPVYKKKTVDEKLAEKRTQENTKTVQKDNTNVRGYNNAEKFSKEARNKTDKEIAEERQSRIDAQAKANEQPFDWSNFRQSLADRSQATGDALRISNEPNFFDDYLNPAVMIGSMADNLGQAPLRAQQEDSFMPYVTAVGTPLAVGAMAGYGTQNTGQFVNNLANPLAGIKNPFKNPQIDLSNSAGKMYGEHPTIVQAERLKNANIKDKYFKYKDYDQPIKENFTDKIKDKGTDINIYNYENFIDDIHNQTAFGEASYFNKSPQNLGSGSFRHKGNIFTDAPLNTQGKAIIEAHEKNHGVFAGTLREDVIKDLKSAFNSSKPIKGYKDAHQADEILARMAQFKNALGFSDNQVFTKGHLDLIRKNYPKEFVDNGITDMLEKIPKNSSYEKKFIQNMNKYAFGITTIAGATYLGTQEQEAPKYQLGGIKTDPMGYWNPENLGSPIVIPSNRISMKNLDFSVLGVADTGEIKLMHPNKEYTFQGAKKVTEYPIEYIKKFRNGQ